jgi:hypothetical protein
MEQEVVVIANVMSRDSQACTNQSKTACKKDARSILVCPGAISKHEKVIRNSLER